VPLVEDAMRVFWYVDWGEEVVGIGVVIFEGKGDGVEG